MTAAGAKSDVPHYHGHRQRLRQRLIDAGAEALADYEMLELVLFRAIPQRDVKPLAKSLLARFGSFPEVIAAPTQRLAEFKELGAAAIVEFKILEAAVQRFAKGAARKRLPMGSWSEVVEYCRTVLGFAEREEFRVLFLDKKNGLIAAEALSSGTIDATSVYPREVVRRALELSSSAIVLVHNHPSGDPTPSPADIGMTKDIIAIAAPLGVAVHDHLVIGRHGHASFRSLRLI
jgi:DNA repair protein RadC